jgi:hypothetical protein
MSEKASVKLSTKKWHYKLIQFILGSYAPTPQNMHNLCPYFWLLVFSILVTPVFGPFKLLYLALAYMADSITDMMDRLIIIPSAQKWEDGLTELDVYQILQWDKSIQKFYQKVHYGNDGYCSKEKFAYNWFRDTYNKPVFEKDQLGEDGPYKTSGIYTQDYMDWLDARQKEMEAISKDMSLIEAERARKKAEYEENLRKFRNGMDNAGDRIKETVLSWKGVIKWTKRIVGIIVTAALLVATYFVVNYASRGVLWIVENWSWFIFLVVLLIAATCAATVLLLYLIKMLVTYIESKGAMNIWYIKGLYYLAKGIYLPFRWVFYDFLWKWVLVNVWYLIKRGARLVWGSLLGFLGIFGEYFGASYTDYCPGIDWEENE